MVMTFSRVSGALAAFVASTALFHASSARANIVFEFSGECTAGCTGTATAVLTLADFYTFGAEITIPDLISFTYTSSGRDFEILPSDYACCQDGLYFMGGLNANGSFNAKDKLAITQPSVFPLFLAEVGGWQARASLNRLEMGSTFSIRREITTTSPGGGAGAVPEPSIWAMMLLGFAGLGFAGYRAKRKGRASNGISQAH
jgi:hypothetical protein